MKIDAKYLTKILQIVNEIIESQIKQHINRIYSISK